MADDSLESRLTIEDKNGLEMTVYQPHPLAVVYNLAKDMSAPVYKLAQELLYTPKHYLVGFLPEEIQKKINDNPRALKRNVISNSVMQPFVTGGVAYYFTGSLSRSITAAAIETMSSCIRMILTSDKVKNPETGRFCLPYYPGHLVPTLFYHQLNFLIFKLPSYIGQKYAEKEVQLIHEETIKSIAEKKAGTLSLPSPGEQGQLSLEDKTGAVSVSTMNEDYFDSSLF
ncbi:MAG: hypothetical protein Q8R37_05735 [Nanoarchaeota archaeon]|nr:hypothetical protein [Nanoarchaeota archaeon]